MKKRIARLLLVAILLASIPISTVSAAYTDTAGHWAEAQIEAFSDQGILTGYDGQFRPDDSITRGEMAVILDRVMDYQVAAPNTFADLGQAFYTDAILKANASGIVLGSGGTVRPTDPITRQEAAVMLGRVMGLEGESGSVSAFTDAGDIAAWAVDSVGAMTARGYLQGNNGQFRPADSITRAEVATLLSRMLGRIVAAGQTVQQDVAGNMVVQGAGVTLKNMTISGDLILAEGIGDGEVTLDNVTIEGRTIIRGGGEHSILMNNVRANGGIVVNKLDGRIRVVTSGNTKVTVVVLKSGAILVGDGFEVVEIPADQAAGQTVELQGNIGKLVNDNADAIIKAEGTIGEVNASVPTNITGERVTVNQVAGSGQVLVNNQPVVPGSSTGNTGSTGGSTGGGSTGGGSTGGNTGGETEGGNNAYGITLDTTALRLEVGQTHQLQAQVNMPEGLNATVDWSSEDSTVASVSGTGLVTGLQEGETRVTASIANTAYRVSCDVTVVENLGWGEATDADGYVDPRFAAGYPICTTENGNIVVKLQIPSASASNPVQVYGIINDINSNWDSDVTSVIHGHAGTNDDMVFASDAFFTTVTSDQEVVLSTGIPVKGYEDIKVHFVLQDATGTSTDVTTVLYSKTLASEVSVMKPYVMGAYLNEARDAIYLHFQNVLNTAGAPEAAAFTVGGVSGVTVTGVTVTQSVDTQTQSQPFAYVRLSLSGLTADSDISNLTVSYDANLAGAYPIEDTATTPNRLPSFTGRDVVDAAITLAPENVRISSDGAYLYLQTTNTHYWGADGGEFTVSVTVDGQPVAYRVADRSYASSGHMEEIWLVCSGTAPGTGNFTVTLTPEGTLTTYAMDPVTQPISAAARPAASPVAITAASYSASRQRLELTVSGELNHMQPYACNFQLLDANSAEVAVARGQVDYDYNTNQIYIDASQLPVLPQSGMQLRYQVLHADPLSYAILTEPSGKPVATTVLPITFAD